MVVQASLIGEAITGKGTLAQLDMETGIPIYDAEPLLLFFILFSLVGAVRGLDKTGMAMFRNDGQKTQLWARLKSKTLRGFLGLPETGEGSLCLWYDKGVRPRCLSAVLNFGTMASKRTCWRAVR